MYSLARELGMTVGQLHREMDARELAEWMALYRLEKRERDQDDLKRDAIRNLKR